MRPPVEKSAVLSPRTKHTNYLVSFLFAFSNIFKIKWPKSEEKFNFGVVGFQHL